MSTSSVFNNLVNYFNEESEEEEEEEENSENNQENFSQNLDCKKMGGLDKNEEIEEIREVDEENEGEKEDSQKEREREDKESLQTMTETYKAFNQANHLQNLNQIKSSPRNDEKVIDFLYNEKTEDIERNSNANVEGQKFSFKPQSEIELYNNDNNVQNTPRLSKNSSSNCKNSSTKTQTLQYTKNLTNQNLKIQKELLKPEYLIDSESFDNLINDYMPEEYVPKFAEKAEKISKLVRQSIEKKLPKPQQIPKNNTKNNNKTFLISKTTTPSTKYISKNSSYRTLNDIKMRGKAGKIEEENKNIYEKNKKKRYRKPVELLLYEEAVKRRKNVIFGI